MAKRKMTLQIPTKLLDELQAEGVDNVTEFLEAFFAEIDAEDLLALMEEEEYWDDEDFEGYEDE